MKELLERWKRKKERLQERINHLDLLITSIENGTEEQNFVYDNPTACQFMRRCAKCNQAKGKSIHKINCTHPEVSKEFAESRTDIKCSIPLESTGEEGMQFCKYYRPKKTNNV